MLLVSNKKALLKSKKLPKHVAVIMDGNGRWAKKRGMPRTYGHSKGMESLRTIIQECNELNIKYLSAYAFSTENWKRPKKEVSFLMALLKKAIVTDAMDLREHNIHISFIGDKSPFSKELIELMDTAERQVSKKNARAFLNLMINYGSRQEIVMATNLAIEKGRKLKNENDFSKYLYTKNIPDPDLLIRTSGEIRISNFLLWQLSYTELYFTKILWPDFSEKEFHKALLTYLKRSRRRGGLNV